ncbi:MAG: glycosyltransferase family 2 protein [Ruminococcus sp.]|nr:glycosyltransferase family 2 protein [Ruminococcus sp.]MDE7104412.1 glycosyltransferase family 2 protein [Ruminococcus sp.]
MKLVSVVVPCYNEEEVLPMFYEEIIKVTNGMKNEHSELEFEFLFINDGSKDRTLELFRELADKDKRVRYISLSRNFGKESGMYAGLKNSKGDYVVVMDADLQHPPEFLPQMYNYVKDGEYDCATTRRVSRDGESKVRSWFARLFYKIMNKISDTEIVDGAQDFRFMTRQMVDAILEMSEYNRFSKGIFSWVGFRVKYMPYENVERKAGTTSWSFWGLFKYSLEGIMAFSTFPLSVSIFLGILCIIIALIVFVVGLIVTAFNPWKIFGWYVIASTVLTVGGLIMLCLGIMGLYLAKMYLEVKKRPVYIAGETDEDYRNRKKAE